MAEKTKRTVILPADVWQTLKELSEEDRRPMNSEIEVLIIQEKQRRLDAVTA